MPPDDWRRVTLRRLADCAMELAVAAQQQALLEVADTDAPAARRFERLARCVRHTVALDARLGSGTLPHLYGGSTEQARRASAERRRKRDARAQVRLRLDEALENFIDTTGLRRDLDDRLEHDDIEALLGEMPIHQIVMALCDEFGLSPDLGKWTDAELADGMATRFDALPDPPD